MLYLQRAPFPGILSDIPVPGEGDAWDHFFPADACRGVIPCREESPDLCLAHSDKYHVWKYCFARVVSAVVHRSGDGAGRGTLLFRKGALIIDSLLFAGCFCFQPVMIFIQCGNLWKGHRCGRPSLKRFLLLRGSWSFGYFLVWFLMAVTVGRAVHLLLFRDWRDGWLWTDAPGCLAACAGLAAEHAAGLKLWKKRVL